jgi:hypothetical protein
MKFRRPHDHTKVKMHTDGAHAGASTTHWDWLAPDTFLIHG